MLCQRLIDGINHQVNLELSSSYLYLGLSAELDSLNLPGMAHWMRVQSAEELEHASCFIKFLHQCDAKLELVSIEKPDLKCHCRDLPNCNCSEDGPCLCPDEMFQEALFQEERITAHVTSLAELAFEDKQYGALTLFQKFLTEQIEEEHSARKLFNRISSAKNSGDCLLLMDFELAKRPCNCSTLCMCS